VQHLQAVSERLDLPVSRELQERGVDLDVRVYVETRVQLVSRVTPDSPV